MKNAVIQNSTGRVLKWGGCDFRTESSFNASTMTQVALLEDAVPPTNGGGVPVLNKYLKVVSQQFVEMSAAEKLAVDAVFPSSAVQRASVAAETTVATGGTDAATGFSSVIGGTKTVKPVTAGDWQITVAFELSMVANATWAGTGPDRAAQARLVVNGVEQYTWVNPFTTYTTMTCVIGAALAEGATPTIDLQIRRFGSAGSARARRIRLELAPTVSSISL